MHVDPIFGLREKVHQRNPFSLYQTVEKPRMSLFAFMIKCSFYRHHFHSIAFLFFIWNKVNSNKPHICLLYYCQSNTIKVYMSVNYQSFWQIWPPVTIPKLTKDAMNMLNDYFKALIVGKLLNSVFHFHILRWDRKF